MAWTPKGSSPASFRLRDAFLALITGDATWGWLVDWLPWVGGDSWSTADFCARGPNGIGPLDPTAFIGPANRNPFVAAAEFVAKIAALRFAAEDRVFAAYCENVVPLSGGWGPTHCWDSLSQGPWGAGGYRHTGIFAPPGATLMNFVSLTLYGTNAFGNLFYVEMTGDGGTTRTYLETGNVSQAQSWTTSKQWAITGGHELLCDSNAGWTGIFCVRFNSGETQDYDPEPQPAPPNYVAAPVTDPSLVGIAHELDLQEAKLDFITQILQFQTRIDPYLPGQDPADDEPLDEDTPKLVLEAIGCVIDVAGIPPAVDMGFGVPTQLINLGYINLGTADAWYPSIPLTHTPMVIRPFPPGTIQVTVTGLPPGTSATIALIQPQK